ncbi:interferon alpha/beta receptor 2-like [Parambassis ranga]|uniref:Interferon alpha/beta receptor 2-like n=1 Tax=Parambassis ranga TaxID=210632 RepID=A0A6P7H2Z6_9TELE|nr:interferon alpha/beta receptor 2-like [Parambassis ranga]XP_028249420.1 interferon alpha/beta receptor 2-like [Parambassis ranga]XP_028249421.1 interferon alpha/beta receptor 2-like [Parambassis ranga]XP_028249422.1 interferon alpha/beta receptor 2-like [Parambassis ranga]XP_028249423.1 interferon alpha/beta receptor 2-like [Parambassis ranga]
MTAHVLLLSLLPLALPAMSELPMPVNVNLTTSSNFNHVLTWEPGPGTRAGVYYQVSVETERGTSSEAVAGCQFVQHPVCNLTEAFPDPTDSYIISIIARVGAQTSRPATVEFKPITHLGLPRLTVISCGRHLCVDLYPPVKRLQESYDNLNYQLQIQSNNGDKPKFYKEKRSLKREVLEHLAPGRQYCVSVRFSDPTEKKESNFSQPVCTFTNGIFSADPLISAIACLLVIAALVPVALLTYAGFICMKRQPLPLVLASIHHIEEVLVLVPHCTVLSSLFNKVPSAGEKSSMESLSDEDDEESATESSYESTGGYKLQEGTNLLSASSSSSSLSAPLSTKPKSPSSSSLNQQSDCSDPHHKVQKSTETRTSAELKHTLTEEKINVREEKKVGGSGTKQDVNLFTLTFGRQEEEELHFSLAEVGPQCTTTPFLPLQHQETKEVAAVKEKEVEEIDECSDYMKRPHTDVSHNFCSLKYS